jgi:hypothetical protein
MAGGEMRHDAKRDASEPAIVQELEARGVSVVRLHTPVDLLLGFRGRTYLSEVKTGKGSLNENQIKFIGAWNGGVIQVFRTPDDARAFVESLCND